MTAPLSLQGRWWLPDHPDHRVFGTLKWNADEGGTLLLQDELRPVVWLDNVLADGSVQRYRNDRADTQRTYPLIYGQVEHRAYTLLDSFRLSAREYDEDERTENVHVNRFLQGAWFDDPDELRVDRLVIDVRHLTGWVNHLGLEVEWPRADGADTDVFAVVTARTLPSFETHADGVALKLTQAIGSTGDHIHALGLEQQWTLRLRTAAPEPIDVPLKVAHDFQHLVSIAVGHTAQFEKVVMHHPALPALSLAGTPLAKGMRHDVIYYVRWSNRTAPRDPAKTHDMYFTFDDLGGIDSVGRWLAVTSGYRTDLSRVMATRYSAAMILEDRIANVCAALDSFDMQRRETGRRVDYARRVRECVGLAGQPFLDLIAVESEHWIQQVVDTRNDLAHHRESFRATGGAGDYLLAEQLFWLFAMCMLRLAEAPPAVFESITKQRQTRWLTEKAEDAKSSSSE